MIIVDPELAAATGHVDDASLVSRFPSAFDAETGVGAAFLWFAVGPKKSREATQLPFRRMARLGVPMERSDVAGE